MNGEVGTRIGDVGGGTATAEIEVPTADGVAEGFGEPALCDGVADNEGL